MTNFTFIKLLLVMICITSCDNPNSDGHSYLMSAIQLKRLRVCVESYHMDRGKYPDNLRELLKNDSYGEPYIVEEYIPNDQWGNEFIYIKPGKKNPFDIIFYGADGQKGGEGFNKDLDCWYKSIE